MRADMFKVLVERPRRGKSWQGGAAARRRDDLDGPMHLGMRQGYGHVGLNENLAPLKRYLRAQVGRPWDKVFSEISARIDRRNTVQQHILQHVDQFIAVQVEWRDGRLVDLKSRGIWVRDDALRQELYVDPRTGIVRVNENYTSWTRRRKERVRAQEAELATRRRRLDAKTMLLKLDEQWYRVEVETFPRPFRRCDARFDVVLKRKTGRDYARDDAERERLYGSAGLYAISKRQISRLEKKEFGVV
jgi:hypothetical protein